MRFLKSVSRKELLCILIITAFAFLSAKAIFHDGFFRTIDDITTVRIIYMNKELHRQNLLNNFPVRMSGELANNYGYPLYLFYSPLIYYVGAALMSLGDLSHIVATKYIYAFPLLIGPFTFYFAARQKLPRFPALVASILYSLFPYRGSNSYLRGAAPEAWAISLLPLVFAGLFLIEKNKYAGGFLLAFFLFLVIVTHTITGMLTVGFVLLYALFFLLKNKRFWTFFTLGLGLSAFYLIPMVYYLKIVRVTYLDINKTYIFETLEPIFSMFHVSFSTVVWRFSLIFILILEGGLIFLSYKRRKGLKNLIEPFFWGITGLLFYLLLFEPMFIFWKVTAPTSGIIQFVWRLLSLLSFIIPFFLGLCMVYIKNRYVNIAIAFVVVAFSLSFLPSFRPSEYSFFYEYHAEPPCATTTWQDEYLPVWVKGCPPPP